MSSQRIAKNKKRPYVPQVRYDRNSIGKTVAKLRSQMNLTQDELAGRASVAGWHISRFVVRRIESGEREVSDKEIRLLAAALEVHIGILFE